MWELDCEEGWVPKNWWFWTVVLEKTLESPLACKEIQTVHSKGDQSWVFFGRNDAKAETLALWPPPAKSWFTGKDSDAGRDWGQEEKGTTEDEMAGWHHRLDGHEFVWIPGIGDGEGGLVCCNSWGHKELDMPERLKRTELNWRLVQGFVYGSYRVRFVLSFVSLFVFPLIGKGEWDGNPVCWWLGFIFVLFVFLDKVFCTGCYCWLGDAGSCIEVVTFVWVLTIWESLGSVLW